jgi:hypothetical protein
MTMSAKSSSIPNEVLVIVFQYCECSTLTTVELVSTHWRSLVRQFDIEIWSHITNELWKTVPNRPSIQNIELRIKDLPLSVLKKSLRAIDLTRCLEKSDFQSMLKAKLLFSRTMEKELSGDDVRFRGRYMTQYYPEWALKIAAMKASYFHANHEVQRRYIHSSELCSIKWKFEFKRSAMQEDELELAMFQHWDVSFTPQGELLSEMTPEHVYHWKVRLICN